tara:strand:- start:325 stop:675 length:351 start_codon:yes stop_codon:yes gene_type:complete
VAQIGGAFGFQQFHGAGLQGGALQFPRRGQGQCVDEGEMSGRLCNEPSEALFYFLAGQVGGMARQDGFNLTFGDVLARPAVLSGSLQFVGFRFRHGGADCAVGPPAYPDVETLRLT